MSAPAVAVPASINDFFEGSQDGDAVRWAGAFSADGVFHDPVGSVPIQGRKQILAKLEGVIPKFSMFCGLIPHTAHTVGKFTAVSWTGAVVTADDRPINWSGITVFTLDKDGRIADAAAYFNHDIFAVQLSPAHG